MFCTRIAGIPCQVKVTSWMEDSFPEGIDYAVQFSVYDRRGYRARWLEKLMTSADKARIENELIAEHKRALQEEEFQGY